MWTSLFISYYRFSVGFQSRDWDLSSHSFVGCLFVFNHFCLELEACLAYLVESSIHYMTKSEPLGRGNLLVCYRIHDAISLHKFHWTTSHKTTPKSQWSYVTAGITWFSLCAVHFAHQACWWCVWSKVRFWSHLFTTYNAKGNCNHTGFCQILSERASYLESFKTD